MIKAIFFDIDGTLLDHSPKGGGRMPPLYPAVPGGPAEKGH